MHPSSDLPRPASPVWSPGGQDAPAFAEATEVAEVGGGEPVTPDSGAGPPAFTTPSVGSADSALTAVAGRPLPEHPEAFDGIHRELQRALSEIDDA